MKVAQVCPYDLSEVPRAVAWLHAVPAADLVEIGLSVQEAEAVRRKQRQLPDFDPFEFEDGVMRWRVTVDGTAAAIVPNETLIVVPRPDQSPAHYDLLKLSGTRVGSFRRSTGELPPWWSEPLSMDARVEEVEPLGDGGTRITLTARELATHQ